MATQESFLNLSYDTKNTRINQLIDQIFKDVSEDDIKVGLIDPILGYVVEVSICEANDYAKDNPGTAFIFRDANNSIQYLNINEVNALTPEVLVSSASTCSGIQTRKKCGEGPPRIQFFGGGGVGAQANAIVGVDGAILAIDVISGGFGYRYPPIVRAIDECQYGSGATLSSELGELSETFVTFEDENDFEDYEICPDTTVGYGRNWGPNGEDLGPWEPETYTNVGKDPIREEIDAYQKSLLKTSNPFWTTKSTPPKSITAEGKKYNIPYVVTDFRWSDFMNLYAISPVPPSNVSGTDEAGKLFVFDWDVDFPYDGEYTFRGLCDNVSKLYVDNIQLFDLGSFNDAVRPTKKELKAGPHNIRIDLLNLPILEVERKQNKKPDVIRRPGFDTTTTTIEPGIYLDLTQYRADEEVYCNFGTLFTDGPSLNIPEVGIVEGRTDGFAGKAITVGPGARPLGGDFGGEVFLKGGRLYGPITIVPNPEYKRSDLFIGMAAGMVNDANVELNQNTAFYGSNQSWVPYISHIQSLTGRGAEGEGSGFAGTLFQESLNAFAILDKFRPEDPDNNNYTPIKYEGVTSFTLTTSGGFFRRITQPITTSSTVRKSTYVETEEPVFEVVGNATVDVPRASAPSTIRNENIFNTVDYISKANRTLWRTNPAASLTSGLLDRYGVCPFDTSSSEAQVESFAGIHTIIWNNINFPVTGDYRIQIAVDDNVSLYIGETLIRKEGFYAPGKRNPDLDQVYTFNQGNYTIRAELENIEVGPIAIRNPMVLAVNIETTFTTGEVVSPKSFNENPMGISVNIDAPPLPVPKEPAPIQTGRCPPSPIWSTRFPSSKEQWYPVRRTTGDPTKGTAWSKFMNRYAISPVPPFDVDETDSAGVNFINTWTVELPYPGFYGVRGTVDNSGRVLIDGKEVSKLDSFGVSNPRLEKVYLEKGSHQIEVEVFNTPIERAFDIPIKVFSTRDWEVSVPSAAPSVSDIILVDMLRYYTEDFSGPAGATHFYTTNPKEELLDENLLKPENSQGTAWKMFRKESTNVAGTVPVYRLFTGGDHLYTIDGGEKSSAILAGYSFEGIVGLVYSQPGPDRIEVFRFYRPPGIGVFGPIPGEHFYTADTNEIPTLPALGYVSEGVAFYAPTAIPNAPPINTDTETATRPYGSGTNKDGVTYEGPALASYVPGLISPFFENTLTPTEEIQGKTFIMTWRNVDFPEDGKYNLTALADDLVIVRVDGVEVGRAKVFEDRRTFLFNATKGKRTVQLELSNIRVPNTGFRENPVVTFVEIIKNSSVSKVAPLPWTTNPIGVSAILIPPPCPKLVKGKGIISKVIVDDPGNGYACPPGLKLNPETGKCEPPPKECPPGQILDPKTGECINICPPGEVYDKVTKKCIKPPIDCPPGQVYDPVTQKCVDLPPNPCPPGQIRNKITGLCEPAPPCPPGEIRNPITGKCEPIAGTQPPPQYPVCLILDEVLVENPGINYNCGVDKLQIVPDNGVILDYVCDSFGRISRVKILDNGTCFPEYPSITMISDTGVNASFRPVFRVVRDPIDPALTRENQKLIQVTDLVGLKQTGYIGGRPYYGAVFYENGIRYAGYYKTVGTLIRVYDTLQESITAEVTTAPSAIEKFGTDNNSNNPRLNIPGTPTNLI
jgi:hypothetical protein